MKKKVLLLFLSFSIVFCVGVSVAYYNTRAYGFDKNASIVSKENDGIKVFDFEIKYNDINNYIYKMRKKVSNRSPKTPIIVDCATV